MSDSLSSAAAGAPANGDPAGNTTCMCKPPPKRKIPIIFAPGVMGSRIHFPTPDQSWDPDSKWAMIHWLTCGEETARTELRFNTAAEIMGKQSGLTDDEVAHGYGGVSMEFYVPFLRFLRAQEFNHDVETPVHAVGYDWRQSNKVSGAYLTGQVDRILGQEGAGQCILVSHSMGGMVTRSAMKEGLAGKVLGVVHVYQPVDGAVVLYRRFFTGAISEFDGGFGLSTILGNTPEKFANTSSGMPGPLQLLPTNNYQDQGGPWLHYKLGGVESSWSGDVFDLYLGTVSPPAITPPGLNAAATADIRANTLAAKAFHAELGHYQHPKTKTVHSTGLSTDMCIVFDPPTQPPPVTTTTKHWWGGTTTNTTTPAWKYRGAQRQVRAEGDGTVPRTSGNPLTPNVEVSGVEHSAACNDGATRDHVKNWIVELLA